ncbi:hypothetical protein HNP40_004093 [Mycobacteroides chelonae]|nr:hypothetical protein [Mycobacteroides chelonae]
MTIGKGKLVAGIVIVGAAAVLVAIIFAFPWAIEDNYRIKDYPSKVLQERAQQLVSGLNQHDPASVGLRRNSASTPEAAKDNAQLDRLIQSALPLPGCNYALDSVVDRGDQGEKTFSWGTVPTHRFDMHLTEHCPGKVPLSRLIGVISRPAEGAHWAEALFVIEQ